MPRIKDGQGLSAEYGARGVMTADDTEPIEKPILLYDGHQVIGLVMKFGQGDWESYKITGLELNGRHRTQAEAAAALSILAGESER